MSKFALLEIQEVRGTIQYFKLVVDGECLFDQFCDEVQRDGVSESQLIRLFSLMNDVANNRLLPREKFRELKGKRDGMKEYEFKKGDMRVYAFKDPAGHIVVMGGRKNSQDKDIRHFRSLKQKYLHSINK